MEHGRLLVAEQVQAMLGAGAVRELVGKVGAVGECRTCGRQLGDGKMALAADHVLGARRVDGDGDTAGGTSCQLVEVTAHHPGCRSSGWGEIDTPSSPSVTYRAQAFSVPLISEPVPDNTQMWRLRLNVRQRRLRRRELRRGLQNLAVCAAVVKPAMERFLYQLDRPGHATSVDVEEHRSWGLRGPTEPEGLKWFTPLPHLAAAVTDNELVIAVPRAKTRWSMPLTEPLALLARQHEGVLLIVDEERDPDGLTVEDSFALLESDDVLAGWIGTVDHTDHHADHHDGDQAGAARSSDEGEVNVQEVSEFLDYYHERASLLDGDQVIIQPAKILDNIALAMERVDVDIDTPVSIEEDVATIDELMAMITSLRLGPTLAAHVVNTAMRIMSARYPAELVDRPLPPEYDVRKLLTLNLTDREHGIAKTIFNRRTVSDTNFTSDDTSDDLEPLDDHEQMSVFIALFYMYGTKVGALKYGTGIE